MNIESLSLHESHAEIKRLRADNATLRTALKNHGEEAARMVAGEPVAKSFKQAPIGACLQAVISFPQGSLRRELLDENEVDWLSPAAIALIGDLWNVFNTSAPTIPAGWQLVSVAAVDELVAALNSMLLEFNEQIPGIVHDEWSAITKARAAITKHSQTTTTKEQ